MLISAMAVYFSCSYVPKLNGIDISHHNVVDWKKIRKNKDIEFCYIKATEGKSFREHMCKKHAKRAKAMMLKKMAMTSATYQWQTKDLKNLLNYLNKNMVANRLFTLVAGVA